MGKLISTVRFPVTVQYNGEMIVVSPSEKINIKNIELLPKDLPAGLILIKD